MTAILAAHLWDLATFMLAIGLVGVPIEQERNPTMVAAFMAAGLVGVAAWKLALVGAIAGLIRLIKTRPRRPGIIIGVALGLVGASSNVAAILAAGG